MAASTAAWSAASWLALTATVVVPVTPVVLAAAAVPAEDVPVAVVVPAVEPVPAEAVPVEAVPVEATTLVMSVSSAVSWPDRPCSRVSSCDSSFKTSCWACAQETDGPLRVVVSPAFCAVVMGVVSAAGEIVVLPPVGVGVGVGDGVVGAGDGVVGVGDGGVGVVVVHRAVARARSALLLVKRVLVWCTVASRTF